MDELGQLAKGCAADPSVGRSNLAILAAGYGCGLRRGGLAALDPRAWCSREYSLTVRKEKGNKARVAYRNEGGTADLEAWIPIRGRREGALFHPVNKGGRLQQDRRPEPGGDRRHRAQAGRGGGCGRMMATRTVKRIQTIRTYTRFELGGVASPEVLAFPDGWIEGARGAAVYHCADPGHPQCRSYALSAWARRRPSSPTARRHISTSGTSLSAPTPAPLLSDGLSDRITLGTVRTRQSRSLSRASQRLGPPRPTF